MQRAIPTLVVRAVAALCDGPQRLNVASSRLVTLRAGGPVAILAEPRSLQAARSLWAFCHREELPVMALGKGSNLLLADSGFAGVVLRLGGDLATLTVRGQSIEAGAGMAQPMVAQRAADLGLSGTEFLIGIPGTVGGGVCMNAGCHGFQFADVVREVWSVTPDGALRVRKGAECGFGVRRSVFQWERELLVAVHLNLAHSDRSAIRSRISKFIVERRIRQPLDFPNSGSVFKNPPAAPAWRLISDAGLRGRRLGGAQVSEKHSNFIVNRGGATATDVIVLMQSIQRQVLRTTGVVLEPELAVAGTSQDETEFACLAT